MQRLTRLTTAASLSVAALCAAHEARADDRLVLGADVEYVRTTSDIEVRDADVNETPGGVEGSGEVGTSNGGGRDGLGLGARLGYEAAAGFLYLRPEIGGQVVFFDGRNDYRAFGGARLGLLTGISPGVFAHIGHGWYNDDSRRGLTGDVGATLDFTALDVARIGVHASYVFNPDAVANWFTAGGHIEFAF
jgi:hypothetical protein